MSENKMKKAKTGRPQRYTAVEAARLMSEVVGNTDELGRTEQSVEQEDFEILEEIIPGDAPDGVDPESDDDACAGGACKI